MLGSLPPRSPLTKTGLAAVAAALLLAAPGCSRQHFRERADRDVAGVLTQKNVFPDWAIRNWHVYPDPKARYADPSRPDRPPYPPDDFASRVLSPNPQHPGQHSGAGRHEGIGYMDFLAKWDGENRALDVPAAPPANPSDPTGGKKPEPINAPRPVEPKEPAKPGIGAARLGVSDPVARPAAMPPKSRPLAPRADVSDAARAANQRPSETSARGASGLPSDPARGASGLPSDPARGASGPPSGPRIVESRQPAGMIVAVGEVPSGNTVIPVVALMPAGPPDQLPDTPPAESKGGPKKDGEPGVYPGPVAVVAAGDAATDYLKALASNQEGYRIKLDQAIELGVLNAREFQDRREDLYLAALPVTLERFNLAAQAFWTEQLIRQSNGSEAGGQNLWSLGSTVGFRKLFPSGGTLLLQYANQLVVDFTGSRPQTSVGNLTLSVAQPFLKGGGYAVTLEPLTLAERNMVYAIRSYARFRKLFYVSVSAGGQVTNNPYGLQGLAVNLGRGVGNNLTAPSVGFLPLLLQAAIIANNRQNIEALEQLLRLYQAFREGGQQSDLQVSQVEQQLLGSRTGLLGSSTFSAAGGASGGSPGSIRSYLDALDNFKLQLGLPLTVGLDLDQTPLRPIRRQLARFDEVYAQVREVEVLARRYDPAQPVNLFRPAWLQLLTDAPLVRGTEFAQTIPARWAAWERAKLNDEALNKQLAARAEERRKLLDRKADRQLKGLPDPPEEVRRLDELEADIELGVFELAVRFYESQPWLKEKADVARATLQAAAFRDVFNAFYQLILEARNERLAAIRQQWPKLPTPTVGGQDLLETTLDDAYTAGIQGALNQRLDLMNARAQVVDAWRQIKVQANSLQGVFNVRYDLGSSTPPTGTEPFNFAAARSTNRLTFNAELPLVRRAERNNYRAALISYQRQRRTLQAFEDNIANDVRADIRELRTIAELYKIQQRLIELGYSQVDNAQAILLAPPAPNAQTDAGGAAALTLQALNAQQSLVNAQNALYTIWVNYLSSRMTLYLDIESMQLDERGVWCDELVPGNDTPDRPEPGRPGGERLPAAVPGPGRER